MTFDELLKNPPDCTKIRPDTDIFEIKDNFKEWSHVPSHLIFDYIPDFNPLVSIMIPTYRRPALLEEAIESALNQKTEVPFEVVVIDNEPENAEIILRVETVVQKYAGLNIRYFRNAQNIGMFGNWNRCIELARGEYISILNDDDLLNSNFLNESSKKLKDCSDAKAVVSNLLHLKEGRKFEVIKKSWLHELDRRIFWQEDKTYLRPRDLIIGNRIPGTLGVLGSKASFINIGGFNPKLYPAADYVFWILYAENFKMIRLDEPLCTYRWEVNESLKPGMLDSFVYCNHLIRKKMFVKGGSQEFLFGRLNFLISQNCLSERQHETQNVLGMPLKIFRAVKLRFLMKTLHLFFWHSRQGYE